MTGQETFVFVHSGLVAMLVVAAVFVWRLSQPQSAATPPELTDVELGALNGGLSSPSSRRRRSSVAAASRQPRKARSWPTAITRRGGASLTGTSFLLLYGASFAVLWIATALAWRACQPAAAAPLDERGLDVVELAALTGGRERAAIAALAALRHSKVRTGPSGTMLADGPLADDATELERELFAAVRASPGAAAWPLVGAAAGGPAVERLLARLRAAGLLLEPGAAVVMHVLWGLAAVLVGAGAIAVVERLDHDTLVAAIASPVAAITAACALLLWWIHNHRCGASAAGRRLVDAIGNAGEGIRGRVDQTAFEVAIFGAGVLWTQDAALATALGLPTPNEDGDHSVVGQILFLLMSDNDGGCGGCGCG